MSTTNWARFNQYRFQDQPDYLEENEESDIESLADLTPSMRDELKEDALMEASTEDLITAFEDKGLPKYVSNLIRAAMARVGRL